MVLDRSLSKFYSLLLAVLYFNKSGLINLDFTLLELEYKELFFIAFIGREQTTYGLITKLSRILIYIKAIIYLLQ